MPRQQKKVLVKMVRLQQLDQADHRYVLPPGDDVPFSEKFSYDAFDLLREFAAFFDHPVKQFVLWGKRRFGDGYNPDALPSVVAAWRHRHSRFPHLVFHEETRGFYFPTALTLPSKTEYGYVGSTISLRDELTALAANAHLAGRHRAAITEAIQFLLQSAEVSIASGLPIVFDG